MYFLLLVSLHEIKGNSHLSEQLSDIDHSHFPLLTFRRMTSYKLVAIRNKPRALDLNENGIRLQPDVFTYKETSLSDDEDRRESEKPSGLHGRSQSLKNLNKREEPGPISRSKSLREMDSGDFAGNRARVAYIESWNPINSVGRGRIAERVKSWENSLDADFDDTGKLKSYDNEMERGHSSASKYNGAHAQSYNYFTRNGTSDHRDTKDESNGNYRSEPAQYTYDSDRDHDLEVRLLLELPIIFERDIIRCNNNHISVLRSTSKFWSYYIATN